MELNSINILLAILGTILRGLIKAQEAKKTQPGICV